MRRFKRTGDAVDVPALSLVDVTKGTIIDVEDTDVADSLNAQDGWEHVPAKPKKRAAKKTTAKKTAPKPVSPDVDPPIDGDATTDDDSQEG